MAQAAAADVVFAKPGDVPFEVLLDLFDGDVDRAAYLQWLWANPALDDDGLTAFLLFEGLVAKPDDRQTIAWAILSYVDDLRAVWCFPNGRSRLGLYWGADIDAEGYVRSGRFALKQIARVPQRVELSGDLTFRWSSTLPAFGFLEFRDAAAMLMPTSNVVATSYVLMASTLPDAWQVITKLQQLGWTFDHIYDRRYQNGRAPFLSVNSTFTLRDSVFYAWQTARWRMGNARAWIRAWSEDPANR